MFVFTNLVDSNVPPGIQMILDTESLQLFCSNCVTENDAVNENEINEVKKNLLTELERITLHEPVRGRVFLDGDVIVDGMTFKKIIQKTTGTVSEIVCPRNVVIYHYYVPKKYGQKN